MKHLITLCALFILAAGFQLNAQTTTEPSTTTETKVATTPAGCHGGAMKPGCCKGGEQAKADSQSRGKKSKKDKKNCCAEAGSANCCASKGDHAGKPCHTGCTMPCCAPKEEKSNQ